MTTYDDFQIIRIRISYSQYPIHFNTLYEIATNANNPKNNEPMFNNKLVGFGNLVNHLLKTNSGRRLIRIDIVVRRTPNRRKYTPTSKSIFMIVF